jgi:hypothetical protein
MEHTGLWCCALDTVSNAQPGTLPTGGAKTEHSLRIQTMINEHVTVEADRASFSRRFNPAAQACLKAPPKGEPKEYQNYARPWPATTQLRLMDLNLFRVFDAMMLHRSGGSFSAIERHVSEATAPAGALGRCARSPLFAGSALPVGRNRHRDAMGPGRRRRSRYPMAGERTSRVYWGCRLAK